MMTAETLPDAPPCPSWCVREDHKSDPTGWDFLDYAGDTDRLDGCDKTCESAAVKVAIDEGGPVEIHVERYAGISFLNTATDPLHVGVPKVRFGDWDSAAIDQAKMLAEAFADAATLAGTTS